MEKYGFMKKFRPDELCIKEFENWIIVLRRKQTTLGDSVILLRREVPDISNMNAKEAAEFPSVVKWYEDICRKKFGAEKFNYIVMMMHDNYVHYHAFPRYNKKVNYFDINWEDEGDKNVLDNFGLSQISDEKTLFKIRDYMIQ